jgi:hypothetical protein
LNATRDLKGDPVAAHGGRRTTATLGADDVSACETDPTDAGCAGTAVRVEHHVDEVQQALAGWDPYL